MVGTPMRHSYVVLMRWMVIYEYGVPGWALTKVLLNHHWNLPLQGKIPMVKLEIESRISLSVVRNSDH
jgi:hypothetical protein